MELIHLEKIRSHWVMGNDSAVPSGLRVHVSACVNNRCGASGAEKL